MEATFESVLRNSLLLEFQTSQLHVPHDIQVPKAVHRAARASLAILDDKEEDDEQGVLSREKMPLSPYSLSFGEFFESAFESGAR